MSTNAGISRRQLCELMGWEYDAVTQVAKQQGLSINAYLQQKTGWSLRFEFYYPPAPILTQSGFPNIEVYETDNPDFDAIESDKF